MKEELDYFRQCAAYLAGDNIAAMLSDEAIKNGKAQILFRDILSQKPALDWEGLDPLYAILALAARSPHKLNIFVEDPKYRTVTTKNTPDLQPAIGDQVRMHDKQKFDLEVMEEEQMPSLRYEPMLFDFPYEDTETVLDRKPFRGQFLGYAKKIRPSEAGDKRLEEEPHFWRCTGPRNVALVMGSTVSSKKPSCLI